MLGMVGGKCSRSAVKKKKENKLFFFFVVAVIGYYLQA